MRGVLRVFQSEGVMSVFQNEGCEHKMSLVCVLQSTIS